MLTYQDLLAVRDTDSARAEFVLRVINEHKGTPLYSTARIADEYARHRNRTINAYQKLLYTLSGKAVPDNYSANYKLASNFFNRFTTQQVQYLLGNGAVWGDKDTAEKVGPDFDERLQECAKDALVHGEAFGFWNLDHLEVFSLLEFAPLYDETNGALMAGVRFWRVSADKPLRATLYELDGYTDYIWDAGDSDGRTLAEKRAYVQLTRTSVADGTVIYDSENYPGFPIVPLWGNPYHQSEIVGIQQGIDAYDLIKSGFANDLDDCSQIYWTIQNAGGMGDIDLAKFVERMKTVKAAVVGSEDDQGAPRAEAHTIDVPYASREALLDRIERDLYRDYMALDTYNIASGAVTATQIEAAYEPLNSKADQFEYCVLQFIRGILAVAGIDDVPTFTRSRIVNANEEIQTVLQTATVLPPDYIAQRVLELLGDGEKAHDILEKMAADDLGMNAPEDEAAAE